MKWGFFMKKIVIFILMSFILSAFIFAQQSAQDKIPAEVTFHNFPWGTSLSDFKAKMGEPASAEINNGLQSLIYDNIRVSGFPVFMLVYFSKNGLEGGTYYFLTYDIDQLMRCYSELRQELRDRFGPTSLYNGILRELRPYQCVWDLPGGFVHLSVNTRQGEPET